MKYTFSLKAAKNGGVVLIVRGNYSDMALALTMTFRILKSVHWRKLQKKRRKRPWTLFRWMRWKFKRFLVLVRLYNTMSIFVLMQRWRDAGNCADAFDRLNGNRLHVFISGFIWIYNNKRLYNHYR